ENAGSAYIYLGSPTGPSSSADWTEHYTLTDGNFGKCVAAAGDVNGDGFADVLIGAPGYKSSDVKYGRAYLYLGGGGNGRLSLPQQMVANSSKIVGKMGKTDNTGCGLQLMKFSPFGRGKVRTQTEFKTLGTPFDGLNLFTSNWYDLANNTSIYSIGLWSTENIVFHWRMRNLYHPVTCPWQSHGPWITIPWNGWEEGDLRLGPDETPTLQDIINYLLGKSHYPHDINTDGKTDAGDVIEHLLINN
ncbi:FG-GAP repeat protein, partial [Candidatus Sumerlaeota bacterium]|nr:FG-GAP repeat protein [Candidatus Sumerlaeota bacterium]